MKPIEDKTNNYLRIVTIMTSKMNAYMIYEYILGENSI